MRSAPLRCRPLSPLNSLSDGNTVVGRDALEEVCTLAVDCSAHRALDAPCEAHATLPFEDGAAAQTGQYQLRHAESSRSTSSTLVPGPGLFPETQCKPSVLFVGLERLEEPWPPGSRPPVNIPRLFRFECTGADEVQ